MREILEEVKAAVLMRITNFTLATLILSPAGGGVSGDPLF